MKRLLLGILWSFLLAIGVFGMVQVWTISGIPLIMEVILQLPLACWAMWTFIMFYDIWSATRPKDESEAKFVEAARLEMKTGGLLYVNDVLYRFTEQSHNVGYDETTSRIVLESVGHGRPFIQTVVHPPADVFKGPMVTPREQDPDY